MIIIKSQDELALMRSAGMIVAEVLLKLKEMVKPGITTKDMDDVAAELIQKAEAAATFVGYLGYQHTLCTSINEEVVHGIPGDKVIQDGDIIGIDCGVTYKGFVADHAVTFPVGNVSAESRQLLRATQEGLQAGIEACLVGNRIGDIGAAVQQIGEKYGYGVVRDFVGHGVGRKMHEEPQVPNFGKAGTGPRIKAGMVLAIEPMFNLGTYEVKVLPDKWTVVTKDGKRSAHFEHTVACTETGPEILTRL